MSDFEVMPIGTAEELKRLRHYEEQFDIYLAGGIKELQAERDRLQIQIDVEREHFAHREFQLSGEIGELRFERDRLARAVEVATVSLKALQDHEGACWQDGGCCVRGKADDALAKINQILSAPAGEEK